MKNPLDGKEAIIIKRPTEDACASALVIMRVKILGFAKLGSGLAEETWVKVRDHASDKLFWFRWSEVRRVEVFK